MNVRGDECRTIFSTLGITCEQQTGASRKIYVLSGLKILAEKNQKEEIKDIIFEW